ncbi:unnamed protein product [Euphydryas editha]|uniref:MYND-type domain-containing protein n=1 Tax=Euphydryas editha TaxID=104508 RepID=A0AAU9UFI3_EUPED|nr:unnamed protein product [Euphydryas editha]
MNSKKSKSKHRSKPPKLSQNVEDTPKVETLSNVEVNFNIKDVEKTEYYNKEEVKTQEPIIEMVQVTKVEEQLASDVPKKPKRSKTKKKVEMCVEPAESENKLNISIATDDQKEETVKTEKQMDENVDIVPVARKKKNKSKKKADQPKVDNELHIEVKPEAMESEDKTEEKQIITTNLEKVAQKEVVDTDTLKTPEVTQKDLTSPKKKKKKKHRHDSDKSDVNDPCTLAFQKLLDPTNVIEEKSSKKIENEDLSLDNITKTEESAILVPEIITESNKSEDSKEHIKSEVPKSKKKNKRGKKPQSESEINVSKENEPEHEEIHIPIDENMELETINIELSSKSKAKIIKPVQKKQKTKSESQEVSTSISPEDISEKKIDKNVEDMLDKPETPVKSEEEGKQTNENISTAEPSTLKETELKSNLSEIKNKILPASSDKTSSTSDISSNNKEHSLLETVSKNEQEIVIVEKPFEFTENKESQQEKDKDLIDTGKESDNLGFVEVKTGKNKKKRSQKVETVPEIIESIGASVSKITEDEPEKEMKQAKDSKESLSDIKQLDFEVNSVKSEECESLSIATPDLIQYPRSTSQQHLDDNNNTTIKEITTPDEIKLGIPIYTSTPIIQGSGESPDAKTLDEPVSIKVSEVASVTSNTNNEKNDIKSRIFEVNKDMEELRRSIERSLAELTGAEKCDSEVDKEFEELFQEQAEETQLLDPEKKLESFPNINPAISKQSDDKIKEDKKENVDKTKPKTENVSAIDKEEENMSEKNDSTNEKICVEDKPQNPEVEANIKSPVPICPARNKGKGKSKKKGKKEPVSSSVNSSTTQQTNTSKESSKTSQSNTEKGEQNQQSSKEIGKQQSTAPSEDSEVSSKQLKLDLSFEPIEKFEDALTSSADDVNKTFEIIANEATESRRQNNPQINIIAPIEDTEAEGKEKRQKENPASQPKNLLGKPNVPALSNKNDFKKEKNKPPSSIQAKVKIKDTVEIEKPTNKESKESQTIKKLIKETNGIDTFSYLSDTNEDFVYKYSFRKVFLQSSCHVCKKDLTQRFPCKFCSLVFYCSQKHLDEDWAKHQFLCFAVSTIAHLKDQKHIYADIQNIIGHDYRILRMQMILSCEKILKRKLVPWEQETLLYPRLCADPSCRQWKQRMLKDCEGCGQISYCIEHPEHLPVFHQRWCKSYALYRKLVNYQQTKGRLEPRLPTKVLDHYKIPDKMNEVLGIMYEEKIDMDDIQYAALTQLASAPLTAAYGYQLYSKKMNSTNANGIAKKSTFTIHAVGTDLQFEADSLNKWEIFFLHLRPDVQDLRVVLIGPDLNPSNLPLELLGKIKLCENCRTNERRVIFHFHDKETYCDYYSSNDFITPDIVCAFNPNIHRSCLYNIEDIWPATINSILKQKVPFIITSYTIEELERDMSRVKETARYNFNVISEPKPNTFSSMRPDRNFITDHEIPLLFKNYCYTILCGVF